MLFRSSHTISVTQEGALAWDKEQITLDEFIRRLQAYHREAPDGRVLINGDENAYFSQAIYAFDEARKAGFQKVLIETRLKQPGT